MFKFKKIVLSVLLSTSLVGCSNVPAGFVGVKVYLWGQKKGVDTEKLGVGRYWIGWGEELYIFPTFDQNHVWTQSSTDGSPRDDSFTFQTKEGLSVNSDIGVTYQIDPNKAVEVFQKYRKGVDEITNIVLRNFIRDAFNDLASTMPVESVYGEGKSTLIHNVQKRVAEQVKDVGIIVTKVYLVGEFRLPKQVTDSLNAKITATQKAMQIENEVKQAQAEAKKKVAIAEGNAQARLTEAEAEAKANLTLAKSLTKELVEYKKLEKWDGKLPVVSGSSGSIVNMSDLTK